MKHVVGTSLLVLVIIATWAGFQYSVGTGVVTLVATSFAAGVLQLVRHIFHSRRDLSPVPEDDEEVKRFFDQVDANRIPLIRSAGRPTSH